MSNTNDSNTVVIPVHEDFDRLVGSLAGQFKKVALGPPRDKGQKGVESWSRRTATELKDIKALAKHAGVDARLEPFVKFVETQYMAAVENAK